MPDTRYPISGKRKEIRKFGTIALVFFGALCALGVWRDKPIPIYLFGALSLLGLGFLAFPSPLKPLYSGWLKVGRRMGLVMTALILALAYYLVITPSAWIKRIFGGRPLPLSPDKKARSYWVTRTEPVQPKERFRKRY
ncbi:MAG: hypothetical protein ABIJ24_02545 [Nitrospinota bacterium]